MGWVCLGVYYTISYTSRRCSSHIYELLNPPGPFVIPSPGRAESEPHVNAGGMMLCSLPRCLALCHCHPELGTRSREPSRLALSQLPRNWLQQ